MSTTIARLRALFNGLDRAHGTYVLTGEVSDRGKARGRASTVRAPVTDACWEAHLSGKTGLGIVPIRDDGTTSFGAIDIDDYTVDVTEIERRATELDLPSVICRTKSGGGHGYFFFGALVGAPPLRRYLHEVAILLGFPGAEVFPKQDHLAGENDVGNWINLPYFDADRTVRYALADGRQLSLEEFLDLAEARRLDAVPEVPEAPLDAFSDGPPCLQHLARVGFPEGSRNNGLLNCAVYAKKKDPEDWETLVNRYNRDYMTPGSPAEVRQIVRSLRRKDYSYMCSRPPLSAHCNREVCVTRAHGIGRAGGDAEDIGITMDALTKIQTVPPLFYLSVNGHRMELTAEDLLSQSRFARRCVEYLNVIPNPLRPAEWRSTMNDLLARAEIVNAPEDAGAPGAFQFFLSQFATQRAVARERDEVLQGRPWRDPKGRVWFRAEDLMRFLRDHRFTELGRNQVYSALRDLGATHKFWNLRGRGTNVWGVPGSNLGTEQDEPFDVPEIDGGEM